MRDTPRRVIVKPPRTVTTPALFAVFRTGYEENEQWHQAVIQTLHNRRSHCVAIAAETDSQDERAKACGAIETLDDLLADWSVFATTPLEQMAAACKAIDQDEA